MSDPEHRQGWIDASVTEVRALEKQGTWEEVLVDDVAMLRHFPQTRTLQETLWKQLPVMCQRLGKKTFKRYLELFFDPLVFTVRSNHRLARHAACECVRGLSSLIGPTIFSGRLEPNPDWKETLGPYVERR